MRNLSYEEALALAKEFSKCKTLAEQEEFCKKHELEIEFDINTNAKELEEKGDKADDNQGTTTKNK